MIDDSHYKYLTDQEFFTEIKFFTLLFNNEVIEDDFDQDGNFRLTDLMIGREELGEVYNRIYLEGLVAEVAVVFQKGYNFNSQISSVKEEIQNSEESSQIPMGITEDIIESKK